MYSFNKYSLNASRSGVNNVQKDSIFALTHDKHVSPQGPDIWASLIEEQQGQSHL